MSKSELNVNGMQKMLTSVAGFAGPPVARDPEGDPISTMVRATSIAVKAPAVRWPQLAKFFPGLDDDSVEQSALDVHDTGKHGCEAGQPLHGAPTLVQGGTTSVHRGPVAEPLHVKAKVLSVLLLQKPQNTLL